MQIGYLEYWRVFFFSVQIAASVMCIAECSFLSWLEATDDDGIIIIGVATT